MRQIFILLLVLAATFGTNQIFGQKKSKPKEVIVLEFIIPKRSDYERFEIPINKIFSRDNETGEGSVSECLDPSKDEEGCRNSYSSYELAANSFLINKNKSRVIFKIEVTDGCKTRKVFNVNRNRRTKIRLNCGVNLIAHYGIKSEKAN